MGRSAELKDELRGQIVGLRQAGLTLKSISLRLSLPITTIHNTIKRYERFGSCSTLPRCGRPPIFKERDLRHLQRAASVNRKVCAGTLAGQIIQCMGKEFCMKTLYNALHSLGFKSCVATRKPYLSTTHLTTRLRYANTGLRSGAE